MYVYIVAIRYVFWRSGRGIRGQCGVKTANDTTNYFCVVVGPRDDTGEVYNLVGREDLVVKGVGVVDGKEEGVDATEGLDVRLRDERY